MNRPDSGSPDQSANQDDAVWLDLVARLEATPSGNTTSPSPAATVPGAEFTGTEITGAEFKDAEITDTEGTGPDAPGADAAGPDVTGPQGAGDALGRSATFRDFDPLGLAGAAPTELSAAERQAAAPAAGEGGHAAGPGPRDYGVEDDGGDFVPDEPPSLAGTDPLTMLAWVGAIGAPIALLLATMFWRSAPLLAIVGMVAVFILAVVYLIMKLPQEKDENDDGARV